RRFSRPDVYQSGRIARTNIPPFHIVEPADIGCQTSRPEGAGAMPSMSALGQKQTLTRLLYMSALPPKADISARDHHHSRRGNEMPCDCARESAAKKEIVSLLFFVCAVRDKPGFLKASFRKSDAMIVVNDIAYHAILCGILENKLE